MEVAGFRSNTAPRLIDVADFFIDLGEISELIRKDISQTDEVPSFVPPDEMSISGNFRPNGRETGQLPNRPAHSGRSYPETEQRHEPLESKEGK